MANINWLRPGLRLKRWVLVICLGLMTFTIGSLAFAAGLFGINHGIPVIGGLEINAYGLTRIFIPLGAALIFIGVYRLVRRIEKIFRHVNEPRGLAELAYLQSRLDHGPRIVCFGGGTGLSTLLSGLREHSRRITAIVSVADDGGSSGRLRHDFDMLPPGDIRNCLVALADAGPMMAELLQYRFDEGELEGHSFGNLFITVMAQLAGGDFGRAVREANRVLSVRGQVLPATLDKVSLVATHPDGTKTTGQRLIAQCGKEIADLQLRPIPAEPPEDMLESVLAADLIVLGPGSLYTSVLPNLLDPQIVAAVNRSMARTIFAVNIFEQPGETPGFAVSDHTRALHRHAPGLRLDGVLVNGGTLPKDKMRALAETGFKPTRYDPDAVARLGVRAYVRDVVDSNNPLRHDAKKLALALMDVMKK